MSGLSDIGFEAILDAAPDAIVGVDEAGVIVLVNAQAERFFGYERCELVGQHLEILVPDRVRALHPQHRTGYLRNPRPRPMGAGMELAGRRRDGSEFPAEISLSAIESKTGTIVVAAVRDVSDRKRADAKFRGLLEAAPDAVVCVGRDGRIALVNAQAERLFGYRRGEMLGQPVELLVPEHSRTAHPDHRRSYFADPNPRPMGAGAQLSARRRDGSEFPAEISLASLDTEDGLLVTAAIRDVSDRLEAQAERERLKAQADRERLQRQLHQSQRLESLGQLAGGVAHDFNNLLGAIVNYASFVGEELDAAAGGDVNRDWTAVRRDVQQIQLATERAANLTHQLLAFARREVVRPTVLSMNDVVSEIEQLLRRTLGEHVELATSLAPDLWHTSADPGQVEQVLVNLAVNARDAMHGGGRLTIQTENVDVDDTYASMRPDVTAGRYARLRVNDTGSGMTKEVLDRVFEPFFTTKPKGEGTGLGLATVYGIVRQAGGHVHIYSEPEAGTSVTILMPATDELAPPAAPAVAAPGARGGETVLVVEDEEFIREVTTRILRRNGYAVLTAATGEEALAAARAHPKPIHLLLTDVVMPKMLGKEVADRVTRLLPRARVLFMSGYAEPVLGAEGRLPAGVSLIEKPFSEAKLLETIRSVLDG